MHLERNEYWEVQPSAVQPSCRRMFLILLLLRPARSYLKATDADWLYAAIYDVDIITGKA